MKPKKRRNRQKKIKKLLSAESEKLNTETDPAKRMDICHRIAALRRGEL